MVKKFFLILFISCFLGNAANAEIVVFNTKTLKIHKTTCQAARNCTKNCIKIEKQEAKKRGGVPCKLCGG